MIEIDPIKEMVKCFVDDFEGDYMIDGYIVDKPPFLLQHYYERFKFLLELRDL